MEPQALSHESFVTEYIQNPAATLQYQRLTTEAEQEAFIKNAAYEYLDNLETYRVGEAEYKLLYYDSTPILWDGIKASITFSRMRVRFFANAPATSEVILNRPMLDFSTPEGCWRPYDLHENCLKTLEVGCGIQMIHDCYVVHKQTSGAMRRKGGPNRTYTPGATIKQIEDEMDIIFTDIRYEQGDYPFEKSWRRDGITPKMVLRYAERKAVKCYVHHKGGKIEAHVPLDGLPGPTINFSVFGNHAYWWTRKIDELGNDRRPTATHAASQASLANPTHSFDCFSDKEINKVFATQQGPAYTEFSCMTEMIRNLTNNQDAYRAPSGTKRVADFNKKRLYFCNTPPRGRPLHAIQGVSQGTVGRHEDDAGKPGRLFCPHPLWILSRRCRGRNSQDEKRSDPPVQSGASRGPSPTAHLRRPRLQ